MLKYGNSLIVYFSYWCAIPRTTVFKLAQVCKFAQQKHTKLYIQHGGGKYSNCCTEWCHCHSTYSKWVGKSKMCLWKLRNIDNGKL